MNVEHCLPSPCCVLEAPNYAHRSLFFVSEEGHESLQRCLPAIGPRLPKSWPFCFLGLTLELSHFSRKGSSLPCPWACQISLPGPGTRAALFPSMSRLHVASGRQHRTTEDLQRTYRTTDIVFLDSGDDRCVCCMIHSTLKDSSECVIQFTTKTFTTKKTLEPFWTQIAQLWTLAFAIW